MRQLLFILTFLLSVSCAKTTKKLSEDKEQIDLTTVTSIEILKIIGPPDTVRLFWKRLTRKQVESFVDKWNTSSERELRKYLPTFKIAVHSKDDSLREFRVNGRFIKERNDLSFNFGDSTYFERLYSEATPKGNEGQ